MLIDLVVAISIILGFLRGFRKGLVKSIASVLAIIIGVIAAVNFSFIASEFLQKTFNISENILPIVSMIAMFILVLVIITIVSNIIDKFLNIIMLGLPNKIIGGALYAFAGVIIISSLLNIANKTNFINSNVKQESKTYEAVIPVYPWFQKFVGKFTPADQNLFDNYKMKMDEIKNKIKKK